MTDQDDTQTATATEPVPADNAEPQIGQIGEIGDGTDEDDTEADGGVTDAA